MKRSLATRLTLLATAMGAFAALPAAAQTPPATTGDTPRTAEVVAEVSTERTVIAVPAFATPAVVNVAGLSTGTLGRQIADVIAADLERSGLYAPLGPGSVRANATSSAVSASCGSSFAGTKLPTSISRTPAAASASIQAFLA